MLINPNSRKSRIPQTDIRGARAVRIFSAASFLRLTLGEPDFISLDLHA